MIVDEFSLLANFIIYCIDLFENCQRYYAQMRARQKKNQNISNGSKPHGFISAVKVVIFGPVF